MNKRIKSKYLQEFIKEIQFKNRNPQNIKALELLNDISTNPEIILDSGYDMYRCRIIAPKDKINQKKNFYGYDDKGSFVPPKEIARDLRANYRYIPYLYCSNDPYTSVVEVRPRLGASVSVATIIAKEKIRLLDFTMQSIPSKMTGGKKSLFSDLSLLYSTPVTNEDDLLDYIPTQFIAEYAKNLGYDGIAFSSSLTPEIDVSANRFNIVVFNYAKCEPKKSNVFTITGNYLDAIQNDTDPHGVIIQNYLSEQLEKRLRDNNVTKEII